MSQLSLLRDGIQKGFYLDNLYEMAGVCRRLAMDSGFPLPYFVMQQVFLGIARSWDERPVSVDFAKYTETELSDLLQKLLAAVEDGDQQKQSALSNEVVLSYLSKMTPGDS